jgi:hypothetical protein
MKTKFENLEILHNSIIEFANKLDGIKTMPTEEEGKNLLNEINSLFFGGAYGAEQYLFDAANKKLSKTYRKFWKRMDKIQKNHK